MEKLYRPAVSRVLFERSSISRGFITVERPTRMAEAGHFTPIYLALLLAGFTSHWNVTISGGELLPHPFTLTPVYPSRDTHENRGGLVSVALSV